MKHTPCKLCAIYGSLFIGERVRLSDKTVVRIASTDRNEPTISGSERDANATRLALCWNMHDELVEALKDCTESLKRLPDTDGAYRVTCLQQARAVLAKLEKEAA